MRRQVHLSFTMQFGGAVLDLVIVVNSLDLLLTPLWLYSLQFGGAVLDLAFEVLGLCSHSFSAVFVLGQTEGQCSEACSHQPSLVTAFSGLWRQEKQRALMLDTTCMHSWWHVWIACCLVDPTLLW
jgi:hypothetical protein